MDSKHITALVWYVAIIWAGLLLIGGAALPPDFFRPLSKVVAAAVLLVFIFDRWLWRWHRLHGWLVKRPNLHGTWIVKLTSSWVDGESGERLAPIAGYLVVRQTFSRVSMRLFTEKSMSRLRGAEIAADADGLYEVAAVYLNDPKFGLRVGNPAHNGAFILAVRGTPATVMEGHYWTDRDTHGEMRATGRVPKVFESFGDACNALEPEKRQAESASRSA